MTQEQETRRNWYASNRGPDSHNQAMIADEETGKTIAIVYAREDAPLIVKACNDHAELVDLITDLWAAASGYLYPNCGEYFDLKERMERLTR